MPLAPGPLPWPKGWLKLVNRPQTEGELAVLSRAVIRGCPLEAEEWQTKFVKRLDLCSTLRSRGRPRNDATEM